ncbi:MAG TPA: FAD-binding oxidoreductase [Acidimicrobiales bacterium]|nr:FAD-binding oxidoreductase [Acidimicrobiales bacterium]
MIQALRAIVGPAHVLTDPEVTASYERDWTGRFGSRATAVVRPGSTEEVAAVLQACHEAGHAVVPQGGNTGLVGGGVPRGGEVVLSLRRLDAIEPVDTVAAQVTAGAGVTLAALQQRVRAHALDVGVDFAARDSATIGGMVATNAGGERVLRYGMTRASVVGLEVVLAGGQVVSRLAGLPKDNVGYDLASLLVGSEGTLGVVTRVRLRLAPLLTERVTALLAVDGTAGALGLLAHLRARLNTLECAEVFYAAGVDLVCAATGRPHPFGTDHTHPAYVLVECAARHDPSDDFMDALATVPDAAGVRDSAVATAGPARHALWAYREHHTEAINRAGVPLKLDVAVPLAALAAFEHDLRATVAGVAPDAELHLFGHLAEGNLHVNILGADDRAPALTEAILTLAAGCGGSISAEHGVGVAKARWLPLCRSAADIAAMAGVKRALDPGGILNPGVLLP